MMIMIEKAIEVIKKNDRGGFTVPSERLYPHQWNWDSVFTALGISLFDKTRAWQELIMLINAQWQDGMIPHIVFHQNNPAFAIFFFFALLAVIMLLHLQKIYFLL